MVKVVEVSSHLFHWQQRCMEFLREITPYDIHLNAMGNTHLPVHYLLLLLGCIQRGDGVNSPSDNICQQQHSQQQQSKGDEVEDGRLTIDSFLRTGELHYHVTVFQLFAVPEVISIA